MSLNGILGDGTLHKVLPGKRDLRFHSPPVVDTIIRALDRYDHRATVLIVSDGRCVDIIPQGYIGLRFRLTGLRQPAGVWIDRPERRHSYRFVCALEPSHRTVEGKVVARAPGYGYLTRRGFVPMIKLYDQWMMAVPQSMYPVNGPTRDELKEMFTDLIDASPAVPGAELKVSGDERWMEMPVPGGTLSMFPTIPMLLPYAMDLLSRDVPRMVGEYLTDANGERKPLHLLAPYAKGFGPIYLDGDNPLVRPSRRGSIFSRLLRKEYGMRSYFSFKFNLGRDRYGMVKVRYDEMGGSPGKMEFCIYNTGNSEYTIPLSEYLYTFKPTWSEPRYRESGPVYEVLEHHGGRAVFLPVSVYTDSAKWAATVDEQNGKCVIDGDLARSYIELELELMGIRTVLDGEPVFLVPACWMSGVHRLAFAVHKQLEGGTDQDE